MKLAEIMFELRYRQRHQPGQCCRHRAKSDIVVKSRAINNLGKHVIIGAHNRFGFRREGMPQWGELRAARAPVKKRHIPVRLKRFDLLAHRRMGDQNGVTSGTKRPVITNGQKGA